MAFACQIRVHHRVRTNHLVPTRMLSLLCRDDMATLLAKAGPSLNVKSLLDNLQLTSEFEAMMTRKWATPVRVYFLLLVMG